MSDVVIGDRVTAKDSELLDLSERHLKSLRKVPGGWDVHFQGGAPTVHSTRSLREGLAQGWEWVNQTTGEAPQGQPLEINGEPVRVDDAGGD